MRAAISFRAPFGLVAAFVLGCAAGCSSGRQYEAKSFPVEGTLRYKDGTDAGDLAGGTLELESGKTVIKIPIASDGTFNRDEKIPAGKYRARIVAPPPKAEAEYDMDARFKQFDTSGLTVSVGDEEKQRVALTLTRTQRPNRQ
jgi:hypothetical protein